MNSKSNDFASPKAPLAEGVFKSVLKAETEEEIIKLFGERIRYFDGEIPKSEFLILWYNGSQNEKDMLKTRLVNQIKGFFWNFPFLKKQYPWVNYHILKENTFSDICEVQIKPLKSEWKKFETVTCKNSDLEAKIMFWLDKNGKIGALTVDFMEMQKREGGLELKTFRFSSYE